MVEREVICSSCGQKVEFPSKEPPCGVLSGWLTLSEWTGVGFVEHYDFCSFTCLKKWVTVQSPEIPKIFLESFAEESGEGNASP